MRRNIPRFCLLLAILLCAGLTAAEDAALARSLLEASGARAGVACVFDADGGPALALAQASELWVVTRIPGDAPAQALAKAAESAGLLGRRVFIERGPVERSPLADRYADLVVATDLTDASLARLSRAEVLRVLSPYAGRAVLGLAKGRPGTLSEAALKAWSEGLEAANPRIAANAFGTWLTFTAPPLAGGDDWGHAWHDAGQNPYSNDTALKPPYFVQWLAKPYFATHNGFQVCAGGRLFSLVSGLYQMGGKFEYELTARNVFNGRVLWRRELAKDYAYPPVATREALFMADPADLGAILELDAATGAERRRWTLEGRSNLQAGWLAVCDGKLLAALGPRESLPEGRKELGEWQCGRRARVFAAWDLAGGKPAWTVETPEGAHYASLAAAGGKLVYTAPSKHVRCLALADGKALWQVPDDRPAAAAELDGLDGKFILNRRASALIAEETYFCGLYEHANFTAHALADGRKLWQVDIKAAKRDLQFYLVRDRQVIVPPTKATEPKIGWAQFLSAETGAPIKGTRLPPSGCGGFTGYPGGLLGQGDGGLYKSACASPPFAANGTLVAFPGECFCWLDLRGFVARTSRGDLDPHAPGPDEGRLVAGAGRPGALAPEAGDWPMRRGGPARGAASPVEAPSQPKERWRYTPAHPFPAFDANVFTSKDAWRLAPPLAVGALVLWAGSDGIVRAVDGANGQERWRFACGGAVLGAPQIAGGRVFVGSCDGWVYALSSDDGALLWRYRAAPHERLLHAYGYLQSAWPVSGSVLVDGGTLYAAAGLCGEFGTHVVALDAATGARRWQACDLGRGLEDKERPYLKHGMPANGELALAGGRLWLRTGNAPNAVLDPETGAWTNHLADFPKVDPKQDKRRTGYQTNRGRDLGVLGGKIVWFGGALAYRDSSERSRPYRGDHYTFVGLDEEGRPRFPEFAPLKSSFVPPAWDGELLVLHSQYETVVAYDLPKLLAGFEGVRQSLEGQGGHVYGGSDVGHNAFQPFERWRQTGQRDLESFGCVLAKNAVLVTRGERLKNQPGSNYRLEALSRADGSTLWSFPLPGEPVPDGLCLTRRGEVIVALADGGVVCVGGD
ncbi:MAG: PQQ-like beta-propeller repeat protein [Planctomycetota bacterium]|nr:PQQ-like beta-propeller repeat protein [Planctomycetota bacterium]